MAECRVCEAAETAGDETLRTLVRVQALTIARLRSNLDTFALAAARARVRDLEETLERMNRTRPQQTAVEVCVELARCDPRDSEERCQWCGAEGKRIEERVDAHRSGCVWRQAVVVSKIQEKRETKAVVDRWRAS